MANEKKPNFLMAGEPDIKGKLLKRHRAGSKTFRVHLDGYNLLPYLTGAEDKSPRKAFFYSSDAATWSRSAMTTGRPSSPSSGARDHARLGRAVRAHAYSVALQPVHQSLRPLHHHVQPVLGLVLRSRLPARADSGLRRAVPGDVQGVPAAAEGRELHHRPGDGASHLGRPWR